MNEMHQWNENDLYNPPPTPKLQLDQSIGEIASHAQEWIELPIEERIALLEQVQIDFRKVWIRWVNYSVAAKGIIDRKTGNDWDWLEISPINRLFSMLLRSLRAIRDGRMPNDPGDYHILTNGQVAARVYPDSLAHSLTFRNLTIDVWLEPGVTLDEAHSMQAKQYFVADKQGRVALVLGAGNASALPTSDTFHKLFVDLCVVILKMNPVNSYIGPLMEEAFSSLIDRGILRIVYGGAEEGNYLVHHHLIDEVHMTGSDRTFDAIVFGTGEEGRRRKASNTPLVSKPVEGELGCITPWIIVPGDWSEKEVRHQAARMAFWMMRHEGYICFAPRILVLHQSWPHRQLFMDSLQSALESVAPIRAYYPGSAETQRSFVQSHPEAIEIGGDEDDRVPWTIIPNLDPTMREDICFRRESFSGLCGEVTLEAASIPDYLDQAVDFLNETVWGTLSATLVVSERSLANPEISVAVERAIEKLRYGTVALNGPGTLGFYTMVAPWGGFPGSTLDDIQSGTGRVTNALMLHRPQKTVVRAPFTWWPYPFLGQAKNLDVFSKKLAEFEFETSLLKLPGLLVSAIRT
jgi:acyl-CoA reductase-like NAD-dependent aldehyde dehydrogenase